MTTPKSVTLFLMDGSPSKRIKCSVTNWIGEVYLIPRTLLKESTDRNKLQQTGVYILCGIDDDTGEDKVYIGQAGKRQKYTGVLNRVLEHIGKENLDYFTHAILITTSNNSFGQTEICYLENKFYLQARDANRVKVDQYTPLEGNVTEEKRAELDEFIRFAKIAIGSLGYRIFEPVDDAKTVTPAVSESTEKTAEPLLFLRGRSADGQGRQTADGFVVLKGSRLARDVTDSVPNSVLKNREKYADRINPDYELTSDVLFSSPSAASGFLMGASTNGKKCWMTANNIPLGDLERDELEPNSDS